MHSITPHHVIYPYSRNGNMQIVFCSLKYAPGLLVQWHKSSIKISAGFGDKLNWHYPYLTICRAVWGTSQQRTNITEGDWWRCVPIRLFDRVCLCVCVHACACRNSFPSESFTLRHWQKAPRSFELCKKLTDLLLGVFQQRLAATTTVAFKAFTFTGNASLAPRGDFMLSTLSLSLSRTCRMCLTEGAKVV